MTLPDGQMDESIVPALPEDIKKIRRVKPNVVQEYETIQKRNPESNSRLWACAAYFLAHPTDGYKNYNEFGEVVCVFPNIRILYEYLKLEIGFCFVQEINGELIKIPKRSNFSDLKDEEEYMNEFHDPAMDHLSKMANMPRGELIWCSLEWSKTLKQQKGY